MFVLAHIVIYNRNRYNERYDPLTVAVDDFQQFLFFIRGELSFDTSNFTHWNGATIIEMLLLAHEMTIKDQKVSKLVQELEC